MTIGIEEWLEAFQEVTREFAKGSLRFDGSAPEGPATAAGVRPAVYIAILGETSSIHLGLSTTAPGCSALVRAMLGLRQRDEIGEKDVVDGLSEILNILAGKVKSRMSKRDHTLKLGLPMYILGQIQLTDSMEKLTADVSVGPVPCQLLVFRNRR
jgi:hypothetical protein